MLSTEAKVFVKLKGERDTFLPEGPREMVVGDIPRVLWVNIQDGMNSTRGWINLRSDGGRGAIAVPGRVGFLLPIESAERPPVPAEKGSRRAKSRKGMARDER